LGALLDFDSDFRGHFLEGVFDSLAGVEVHSGHHQQKANRGRRKPTAKMGNLESHLKLSLLDAAQTTWGHPRLSSGMKLR